MPGLARALVWFRRDLRDDDHAALSEALHVAREVHCAFVLDRSILDALPRADRRVAFLHASLVELDRALRRRGGGLVVRHGFATDEIPRLARELGVEAVFVGRDYEPDARRRDAQVQQALAAQGIELRAHKDQAIFEERELVAGSGRPYTVYTPYRKAWLARLTSEDLAPHACRGTPGRLMARDADAGVPPLAAIGFDDCDLRASGVRPGMSGAREALDAFLPRLADYRTARDLPALPGTSGLSAHLRFGTIAVRELVRRALEHAGENDDDGARTWLGELVWREFFMQLLANVPRVVDEPFRPEYRALAFPDDPSRLAAWQEGRTGYPLVDAAMRELAATGRMHNRLRMVTASFLVKDLLVDWRLGERHFARLLLDFELASNNGNWQWAASVGCDAQPWFRIFNPVLQSKRFDPDGDYIRRHVPELAALDGDAIHAPWEAAPEALAAVGVRLGTTYPRPIVDHAQARAEALALYRAVRERFDTRGAGG